MNLTGKTALVTGGTKGIGLGITQALLQKGIAVAITGRTLKTVQEVAEKLNQSGKNRAKAIGLEADVRDFGSQQRAVEKVIQTFGKLDIVVANAGIGQFSPIDELEVETWQKIIDTNLTGVFYTLKTTVEELKKNKGYFITISSLAGAHVFKQGAAYNASKFGVTAFTDAVLLDLREYGVKVSTIMPGSVQSNFNGNIPDKKENWKLQKEDIGEVVLHMLQMPPHALPSKIQIRPSQPPSKK